MWNLRALTGISIALCSFLLPETVLSGSPLYLKRTDPHFQALSEKEKGKAVRKAIAFLKPADVEVGSGAAPTKKATIHSFLRQRLLVAAVADAVTKYNTADAFHDAAPANELKNEGFATDPALATGKILSCGTATLDSTSSGPCGTLEAGLSVATGDDTGELVVIGAYQVAPDVLSDFLVLKFSGPAVYAVAIEIVNPYGATNIPISIFGTEEAALATFTSNGGFVGFTSAVNAGPITKIVVGDGSQAIAIKSVEFGDPDIDKDTIFNKVDNCILKPNTNQANQDEDSAGDACDECPTNVDFIVDVEAPRAVCGGGNDVLLGSDGTGLTSADAIGSGSYDVCGNGITKSISKDSFTCGDIGDNNVDLTVQDTKGLSDTCTATVVVSDETDPVAKCKDVEVEVNAIGTAAVAGEDVNDGSTDNCDGLGLNYSLDTETFDCSALSGTTATLTVADTSGNEAKCTATVTTKDTLSPTASCKGVVVVNLVDNDATSVTVKASDLDGGSTDDGCGIDTILISGGLDSVTFSCSDINLDNTVQIVIADTSGNTASCDSNVKVMDQTDPTAKCKEAITVNLDGSGTYPLTLEDIDNSSTDNCEVKSRTVSPTVVGCDAVGQATVATLTVSDTSDNTAQCTAPVTVKDEVAPTAKCKAASVSLDAGGTGSILQGDVDDESSDACGIGSLALSKSSFDCSNVGTNQVTLTVTDVNSNVNTCTAGVTIIDSIKPTATCKNFGISLGDDGSGSIVANDINDGSTDACGIKSLTLSKYTFTCDNLGGNSVTLSAVDNSENTASCEATVSVADTILPSIICKTDLQLSVAASCKSRALAEADVVSSVNDNCPGTTSSFDKTELAIGTHTIPVVATDTSGNTATCDAKVVVTNKLPTARCISGNFYVPAGATSITPANIDAGSSDPDEGCTFTLSLDKSDSFPISDTIPVTLTITDSEGATSSCTANVINLQPGTPRAVRIVDAAPNMTVQILDVTPGFTLSNNDVVTLTNAGATYQYKVLVNNKTSPAWIPYVLPVLTFKPDLSVLEAYTTLKVAAPSGVTVQIRGTTGTPALANDGTMVLPRSLDIEYSVSVNGLTGPWRSFNTGNAATVTLDVASALTLMTISIPADAKDQGAIVNLQNVDGSTAFRDGDTILLPSGATIGNLYFRVSVNGLVGGWTSYTVSSTLNTTNAFGTYVSTTVPPALFSNNTGVPQIEFQGCTRSLSNTNTKVVLPSGITIKKRSITNGYDSGNWGSSIPSETVAVGTTTITATSLFCTVTVSCTQASPGNSAITDCTTVRVDLQPSNSAPQGIPNQGKVVLLPGLEYLYKLRDAVSGKTQSGGAFPFSMTGGCVPTLPITD